MEEQISALVPLPKEGFCTITLDHYVELVKAQSRLEDLEILINERQYDAAFELLIRGATNGSKESSN